MTGTILPWHSKQPDIHRTAFIAPTAVIIGDTVIGQDSSIWFGTVVRGDVNEIRIGTRTNIQDNSVIHVSSGGHGTYIGSNITVGHRVILHACTLEDRCFVGMGAVVMDGVIIESCAMIAANAMITPGKRVRSGELWAGSPARFLRSLSKEEIDKFTIVSDTYLHLSQKYRNFFGESRTK